jgi:hypothetical protein
MATKKKINKIKLNYNNDKILLSSMVTEKKIRSRVITYNLCMLEKTEIKLKTYDYVVDKAMAIL